ncbi:LytTR family transcriptional regulator DNA-binding domain-containing protein [Rossellomorea sp. RS05]|uniref:LytR/AlgR family response regulator transcription factor n=1 Tax=Rossellomorea sp. RS05 TaxID=3149166 RepID=UPI001C47CF1B|nr:LytTR family transcriptional regulator DNA-binding domain-containing protein [Bacillus sp. JRC01]
MKLNAFIVDDEPLARDELAYLLKRTHEVEVIGQAGDVEDALEQIRSHRPDILFLDIELSEESGLMLATEINKMDQPPFIIFATAYDEFALEAFELNAVDYLLKPFGEGRVRQTIAKVRSMMQRSIPVEEKKSRPNLDTGKFAIATDERIFLIDKDAIVYIGTSEGRTELKTVDSVYQIPEPLSVVEKRLDSPAFLRVHRSYIIQLTCIEEIQPWFNSTYNLIMKDGSKVPVSRTYVKELKHLIGF